MDRYFCARWRGGGHNLNAIKKHFLKMRKCDTRRFERYWKPRASMRNPILIRHAKQLILNLRAAAIKLDFVMEYFKNKAKSLEKEYDFDASTFAASSYVIGVYPNALHKKDDFLETIELPFEDTTFPLPKNYDLYLTKLYGDYMQLPPPEERIKAPDLFFLDLNLPFSKYKPPYIKR